MNLRTVATYALGTAGGAFISLITLPIMAWLFTQEDIGKVAMFQIALSLLVVILSLGLDQGFVREFHEEGGGFNLAKLCILPGLVLSSILVVAAYNFRSEISYFLFNEQGTVLFLIFCFTLICLYFERFLSVFVRMKELSFAYSMTRILPKALVLILVLIAYKFNDARSFVYLASVQSISWLLAVSIMAYYLRREIVASFFGPLGEKKLSLLFSFGFPLVINGLAFWGLSFLDRIMVKQYSSLSELGLYAIASSIAGVAVLLQQIFSTLWHPTLYKWIAEGIDFRKIVQVAEGLQILSFVVVCFTGLVSWTIPLVLPDDYSSIQYFLTACLIPPLFIMVAEATGVGINISRATKFAPIVTFLSLVLNATLNVWLIPRYGAAGAAAASAASFCAYLLLRTEASIHLWKRIPRLKFYFCALLVTLAAACQALSIKGLQDHFYWVWILILIVCLFLYRHTLEVILIFARKSR